jgi:ribonuclease P protein component
VPKHQQSSVARNRLKRRLRELVRLHLLPDAPSADIVIRARREAYSASFDALSADVERVRTQARRPAAGREVKADTPLAPDA